MHFDFLKYRKIHFIFAGILILASLFFVLFFGLKPGIDFSGGTILEIEYRKERPSNQEIRQELSEMDLGEISIQPTGERGVLLRLKEIDENRHQEIVKKLGDVEDKRFETIGPSMGAELKKKTKFVIFLAIAAVVFYVALAFRKVSRPVKPWQYGVVSLAILSSVVLIPLGVFAVLGKFYGVQTTSSIIIALLTVVGYAINNVVVIFDRLRENLLRRSENAFEENTNLSINQTLFMQMNTSITTLLPLIFIFSFGGETLKYFALALIIGICFGTYSSIFLAGPVLVSWLKYRKVI